jgi:anti-sigma B factor antagonist
MVGAEGEIDLSSVDRFRSTVSELVREKPVSLIFDLRKVTFIDSSGLGVLVAARRQLGGDPASVIVVTEQPAVLQSLQITGLDRILRVVKEEAAARAS